MAFCVNCGHEYPEGAKFCLNCGSSTNSQGGQRKLMYEGELHKCPNCGETLEAFSGKCLACGYELRNVTATKSVKELGQKLEEIESKRPPNAPHTKRSRFQPEQMTSIDEEKVSLIRSFAIPNTREDLYEFLILAKSNIDVDLYNGKYLKDDPRLAISDAWRAKFEQAFQKMELLYDHNDPEMATARKLNEQINKSIKKAKRSSWIWLVYLGSTLIVLLVLSAILEPIREKKEDVQLQVITEEISAQLDAGQYKLALMNAENLVYDYNENEEFIRKWKIKREYWIDRVIDEAASNGISLEHPKESVDDRQFESDGYSVDSDTINEFIEGYEEADFDKFNSFASDNGLGGTKIFITGILEKTEILEAKGTKTILGFLKTEGGNTWLIMMHAIPMVSETYFDSAVGKEVICTAVYDGYSRVYEMPDVVLDELLVLDNGTIMNGLQKVLS